MGDTPPAPRRSRRRTLILVAALIAVLYLLLGAAVTLYTDRLWFKEVRYSSVFRTMAGAQYGLGAVAGLVFVLLLLVNLRIVRQATDPSRAFRVPDLIRDRYRATLGPYKRKLVFSGIVLGGVVAGTRMAAHWQDFLLWRNHTSVGRVDPVFGKDVGYYLFELPFQRAVHGWALASLIAIAIVSLLAHYVRGGIRPQRRGERISPGARRHLSVLLGLILALMAAGYRLARFDLLGSDRGAVAGAGYTDVNARIPALRVLVVVAIVSALTLFANALFFKRMRWAVASLMFMATAAVAAGALYPGFVQRFKVRPDERALEQPFIQRNIEATRVAYGLSTIESVPYPATGSLEPAELAQHQATIENVRLWDPEVLQSVYQNLQRIKQYYRFVSPADEDRYPIDGRMRAVMIAEREISVGGLGESAKTWVNTHLFYTHGYGIVVSSAVGVASGGQPDFLVKNVPPTSTSGVLRAAASQIYYGEKEETPFVIVRAKQRELDYPTLEASGYVTTRYEGRGGIRLDGFLERAAFAWRFRDLNVLISGAITEDSRIMFRRRILDRVSRIAPFLTIDGNPYPAIVGGRVVWIVDGYTTSARYPYSQPADFGAASGGLIQGSGNYIRDAVKFVVDAKNGTVDGYMWDPDDPVLQSWLEIFPGIFKPRSAMPEDVAAHLRYPEGLFHVQSNRFADYHVTDAGTFYQKEDAWVVARDPTYCLNTGRCGKDERGPAVPAYHALTQLPAQEGLHFVLARPFTPAGAGRQNLVSYLVARGDPADYGTITSYEFPRSAQIFGPEQVEASINQDPAVTQQVSLWNQQHSTVIYGDLLIVPLPDALLYVQPLYLRGEGSQIPELKRVVVVANGRVAMADTLQAALGQLFVPRP